VVGGDSACHELSVLLSCPGVGGRWVHGSLCFPQV